MLYNLHFFSSKCLLFHNATLFGFCITHNLKQGVLKFEKNSVAKRLMRQDPNHFLQTVQNTTSRPKQSLLLRQGSKSHAETSCNIPNHRLRFPKPAVCGISPILFI